MALRGRCRFIVLAVQNLSQPGQRAPAFSPLVSMSRTFCSSARTFSLDSYPSGPRRNASAGAKAERVSPSSGRAQRNLSAVALSLQKQPLSCNDLLDLGEMEENRRKALTCRYQRRFIVDPKLARTVTDHLIQDIEDEKAVIFECNPGPGVLTCSLINCGAQRVVALESDNSFLPDLQALERKLDGQLKVMHCDFFKLDPVGQGSMIPPAMYSEKLFTDLGIPEVPWSADVPVKVVGIFSQRNERGMLWKLIYALFERLSVFRYGRVELIMFISEKEYRKLVARPGDTKGYQALSALWQMACDIELLHQEPWSSFVTTSKHGGLAIPKSILLPNEHLCLVRLTPREDLFTSVLTPFNSNTLVMMVKQCLAKRKSRLVEKLNSWNPGGGQDMLAQAGLLEHVLTGQVYPQEYKRLFELIDKSEEFSQSWLYKEILENTQRTGCCI
ncbi:dimethyladenosine transferase 2, mitochondrial [Electrophorus electricus]|uniref:rRNA adenine N(6)-methyltransferase n=1 Tax=Electrophorus electricus TaxID=8005 RepID=A0A4W4FV57_ELEEL|nr:dimethyladenosine transferase 2, mitochondrial [Electrophorus electricus]